MWIMSAKEKQVVQIFESSKRIIEQARQQCYLWEHHLSSKLILNGISPPPWLCDSLPSLPKELNKDDLVSDVLFSQPQFRVPFPGPRCSLSNNLGAVSDDIQYPIDLHNEVHALKKGRNTGEGLSNLPDCSVNNDGCVSTGPPELDSGSISPQNQIEPRVSDSYHDPALSLAKLQRSKSRQRALELRNSAKAPNHCPADDNAAGVCAGRTAGSASSTVKADHIQESDLAKDFHSNVQSCFMEELRRGDCLTQKYDNSNNSGCITRSTGLAQKFNSLNVASSSVVKEDGPPSNNLNEPVELVNRPCFTNGSCGVKAKERLSRSHSGELYITRDSKSQNHIEEILKSLSSNFCEQFATCSKSAIKKSQNVQLTELDAGRFSSSQNDSKLDTEISMNSAEKENIAAVAASRNARAVTTCITEGSLKPMCSSDLDGGSLLAKSLFIETAVAEKVLDAQENILSGANPADSIEDGSATTVAKVISDFDVLVEKDHSCLGSKFTRVSPKVGLDVSVLRLPSDFVMSVMPKQLDFDGVEESSMNEISSPDLKEGRHGMSPEEEPLNLLEPVNLPDEETSLVCQGKCNSLEEMHLLETQEALIREEGPQMEYCASHFKEADVARKVLNDMSPNKDLPAVQKEFSILTSSLTNHSSALQVAGENSSQSLSKEVKTSKFVSLYSELENDESITKSVDYFPGNGLHKYTGETVTNLTVAALTDDVNVGLTHQAPSSISLCRNGDLLRPKCLSDGKKTGFSTDFWNFKSSIESLTYDVEHSCPQHKRRKIEIETNKFLPASSNSLEKPLDSIDQRTVTRNLSIEEENHEILLDVQHLTSKQKDDRGLQYVSNSPMEEMQDTGECRTIEESSLKVRKEESSGWQKLDLVLNSQRIRNLSLGPRMQKLIMDGRDRSAGTFLLAEADPSGFSVDLTMRCTIDGKVESCHHQVNCGQESAEHVTCVERSTLSRRIYPGGNAKFAGGSSVSPGIQCLDLIGTDDSVPEFEGFIMQTDNAQPCTAGDQMELEKMNLLSNSIDHTSLGKSRFMHSPLCYSSTPYKLRNIPELYPSLPNGLLEGMGLRTSLPLNDGSARSLSDCLPNSKGQYTPSVQTIWDRINSNYGSSGKRQSLKLELPSISEENENVDEIADTFQKGIGSEGMISSITREPLAEIIDNANPATVFQDDILTDGRLDFVSSEFNFSGTHNKVKKKLDKRDGNRRRFTSKGKENQGISLGENGAKRTSESVCNRSSRPKLSGKDSMKQHGPTYSEGKSTRNNIVSNITSFIPLVQQKQAAAVFTGKRDIKVKALEAAEAAKRMAEKKENERKMKKEALRLERERLEQQNLKQLELQKKKKEEERKKKEAEMAAKKRQREEEEKREKERKRKRVNDAKKQQQEHEKIYAKKEDREIQCRATGEEVQESKKFIDERENHKNLQLQDNREVIVEKISETEPLTIRDSTNDKTKESCFEYSEAVNDCANNGKVMGNLIKATEDDDLIIKNTLQEQSYEISPYKGSDDEDEDEDDIPNNKFIPSWASKHRLSLIVSSQKMDLETIFPPQSFCNIAEVLMPRKLQL